MCIFVPDYVIVLLVAVLLAVVASQLALRTSDPGGVVLIYFLSVTAFAFCVFMLDVPILWLRYVAATLYVSGFMSALYFHAGGF